MATPFTPEQLAQTYRGWIRPTYITADPSPTPTLVVVYGQPGGGLTAAIAQARRAHPGAYAVNAEQLERFAAPTALPLEQQTAAMQSDVQAATAVWARALLHDSRTARQNVIIPGSPEDDEITLQTVREFAEKGYNVEVVALGTPRRDSLLNALGSPLNRRGQGLPARNISSSAHNAGYDATRTFVTRAVFEPAVSRVTVLDSRGKATYDQTRPAPLHEAVDALDQTRARQITPTEAKLWLHELRRVDEHAVRAGVVSTSTLPYFREMHQIADNEALPALGLPDDSPALQKLQQRNRDDLAALTAMTAPPKPALSRDDTSPTIDTSGSGYEVHF